MIDVNEVFLSVRDIILKGKGGYMTNEEYNRHLQVATVDLFEYYFNQFEKSQRFPEALRPFVVPAMLALSSSGAAALPDNFVHALKVSYRDVQNVIGVEPQIVLRPVTPIHASELSLTLTSPIRKPNISKNRIYFRIVDGDIQLYLDLNQGEIDFEYLRKPTPPVRAVTIDNTNDEENYNSGGSTQSEFPPNQFVALRDLVLFHYGVQVRQSEIINFAASKTAINQQLTT